MTNSELFKTHLASNGWEEPSDPNVHHQNTGDAKIIQGSNAYLVFHPVSTFQVGCALFELKNTARIRLYNTASGGFHWLEIAFGDKLDSFLEQLTNMQMDLPSKSYLSLMGGAFGQDMKVSLLAWEQFI